MSFDKQMNIARARFEQGKPEIITGIGIGGILISSYFFIRGTFKSVRKIDAKKEELGTEKLDVKDIIALCWMDYLFPVTTLGASIGLIVKSDSIKAKETGELVSMAMLSRSLEEDYRKAVKEVITDKEEEEIEEKESKNIAERVENNNKVEPYTTGNGNTLFIESLNGTVFRSSERAVRDAFARAERQIRDFDYISINDLRDELDLRGVACGEILGYNHSTENGHIDYKLQPSEYFGELCWIIQVKTKPIDHYSEIWPYK